MAFSKKINTTARPQDNTGFGDNAANYGGRFVTKEGGANIEKSGISFLRRVSWFHSMLALPRWKFICLIFIAFITVNIVFALIYLLVGIDHLGGLIRRSPIEDFAELFFFSCQTFTTVGYGRINPVGFLASSIASFEALLGLLFFAIATGLFYGRFSRPKAYLKFSENAVIAPYKDHTALMLRVVPYKNTLLVDAEAKLTLGLLLEENGKTTNKFFQLPLEFALVNTLTLSWTIVHPITAESPLYNLGEEDFGNIRGEILVFIKAFDDMFSNTVVARSSYIFKEVMFGKKFMPMYHRSSTGNKTILEIDKLNDTTNAELPSRVNE